MPHSNCATFPGHRLHRPTACARRAPTSTGRPPDSAVTAARPCPPCTCAHPASATATTRMPSAPPRVRWRASRGCRRCAASASGALFDEVFKRRTPAEIEDHLMAGTLRTTPPVTDVSCDWPRPWMFARLFLLSALLFAVFWGGYRYFENGNLVPGAMVIGSFVGADDGGAAVLRAERAAQRVAAARGQARAARGRGRSSSPSRCSGSART